MDTVKLHKRMVPSGLADPRIMGPPIGASFQKLDPRVLIRNPVMFVVEIVAALTTVILLRDLVTGGETIGFTVQITLWLWFTVLFANFAEAVAERRGKAQADTLRRTRTETQAKRLPRPGRGAYRIVPGTSLRPGDVVLVEAGDIIPSDGEVIEGVASVNEAAITGESPGHPGVGRRPLGRYGRHPGPVRLDPGEDHGGAGLDLPRSHDPLGRGRRAPEDPERDRAQHPAGRDDPHFRVRDRHDPKLCDLCRGRLVD